MKSNDTKFLEDEKLLIFDKKNVGRQKEYEKFFIGSVTNMFSFVLYIVDIYIGKHNCWFFKTYLRSYVENKEKNNFVWINNC